MFVNVKKNGREIELSAVGSTDMKLLEELSKGVHVQAYDGSKYHASWLIITPELLPDDESSNGIRRW